MKNLPKSQRNIRMWMEKDGLESESSQEPTKIPKTFRQLSLDYNLSIGRLLTIVNRERRSHGRI